MWPFDALHLRLNVLLMFAPREFIRICSFNLLFNGGQHCFAWFAPFLECFRYLADIFLAYVAANGIVDFQLAVFLVQFAMDYVCKMIETCQFNEWLFERFRPSTIRTNPSRLSQWSDLPNGVYYRCPIRLVIPDTVCIYCWLPLWPRSNIAICASSHRTMRLAAPDLSDIPCMFHKQTDSMCWNTFDVGPIPAVWRKQNAQLSLMHNQKAIIWFGKLSIISGLSSRNKSWSNNRTNWQITHILNAISLLLPRTYQVDPEFCSPWRSNKQRIKSGQTKYACRLTSSTFGMANSSPNT